jgi:hypothetical protein
MDIDLIQRYSRLAQYFATHEASYTVFNQIIENGSFDKANINWTEFRG